MGPRPSRVAVGIPLVAAALAAIAPATDGDQDGSGSRPERRRPADHVDAGLPIPGAVWLPYDDDPDHPANRFFRLAFVVDLVPDDVGWALPRERGDGALPEDWMLRWRDGGEGDRRLFGGDGRQLPREGFGATEEAELRSALAEIEGDVAAQVRGSGAAAVLLQHDLLRVAMRLARTERNPSLVLELLAAARRVALSEEQLRSLPVTPRTTTAPPDDAREATATLDAYRLRDTWGVEVGRRSTRLFDASRTLLWSRVWFGAPAGKEATADLLERARAGAEVDAPVGARALLVQGIVAITDSGAPHATDLIVDLREQRLVHKDGRSGDDPTTSRDGVDFTILQIERERTRRSARGAAYRSIGDDDQDLFRDYGTLKHTTYRAQCSLCHRTTRTPEPELGGFPILRPQAEPRLAGPGERERLAERQVSEWLATFEGEGGR